MAKTIGIGLNVTSKDADKTAKQLGEVRKRLDELSQAARDAKKSGDVSAEAYGKIKKEQTELQETSRVLTKEIRDQQRAFNNSKFPSDSIVGLRRRYRELFREIQQLSTTDPAFDEKAREAAKLSDEINELNKRAGAFKDNIGRYAQDLEPFFAELNTALLGGFGALLAGDVAGFFVDNAQAVFENVRALKELRVEVQKLTQTEQAEGDGITARIEAISKAFNVDAREVLQASNSLTKQLTGDFEESFDLIERGFLAGADSNGEFLDSVKEYPAFFKEAGASGEQFISTVTQGVQQGVFSDKAVDQLKEFTLRVRELPAATEDALKNIGLTGDDIKKEIEENGIISVYQQVQEKLRELEDDSVEVGAVLADVFGGAGEDTGVNFLKTLDLTKTELEDLTDTQNIYIQQQQRQLQAEKALSEALVNLANVSGGYGETLKVVGTEALAFVLENLAKFLLTLKEIPAFIKENRVSLGLLAAGLILLNKQSILAQAETIKEAAARKGAAIAARAQMFSIKGLTAAFKANPIGFVLTALGLFATAIKLAYDRSERFRGVVAGLFSILQEFGRIVKESFSNIVGAFSDLSEGNIKGAFSRLRKVVTNTNPVSFFAENGKRLKDAFVGGYTDKLAEEMQAGTQNALAVQQEAFTDPLGAFKKGGGDLRKAFVDGYSEDLPEGIKAATDKATDKATKGQGEKLNEEGKKLGKSLIDGFKEGAAPEKSLAGIEQRISSLKRELSRAPDAESYAEIERKLKGLQDTLAITERAFKSINREREALSTVLETIETTPINATDEELSANVLEPLQEDAEVSRARQTEEEIFKIKERNRERNLERQREINEMQLEEEAEFREAQGLITEQAFQAVGGLVETFIADQNATFRDFLKGVVLTLLDALEKTILLLTVEAKAKAFASTAGVPGVGLALGAAKAALIGGVIKGLFAAIKGQIQSFNTGGVVQALGDYSNGGMVQGSNIPVQPGGDSVFTTLKPREMVLTERQQKAVLNMAGGDIFARAGIPGAKIGGQITTPQLLNPTAAPGGPVTANIDEEQAREQGRIIAGMVGEQVYQSVLNGYKDAERRREQYTKLRKKVTE